MGRADAGFEQRSTLFLFGTTGMSATAPDSTDFERHQWLLEQYTELASLAAAWPTKLKTRSVR